MKMNVNTKKSLSSVDVCDKTNFYQFFTNA